MITNEGTTTITKKAENLGDNQSIIREEMDNICCTIENLKANVDSLCSRVGFLCGTSDEGPKESKRDKLGCSSLYNYLYDVHEELQNVISMAVKTILILEN